MPRLSRAARRPLPGGDVRAAEPGPRPLVRVAQGLALGAAVGVLAALVTPRPDRARRTHPDAGH